MNLYSTIKFYDDKCLFLGERSTVNDRERRGSQMGGQLTTEAEILAKIANERWSCRGFRSDPVPHETIESKIVDILGLSGRDERPLAVMGIQDEAKGEALVLLSAVDIDLAELRGKLQEAGVPNLWIPKHVQRVEAIPVLASGKLDLKKCQALAAESPRR